MSTAYLNGISTMPELGDSLGPSGSTSSVGSAAGDLRSGQTGTAEILEGLNDLLQLDHDAVEAYGIAMEKLKDRDHADQIAGFRRDHEQHIRELSELVEELGGSPMNQGHATGPFKLALQSIGALAGDRGTLMAFRTNELQVRAKYDSYAARANMWPTHIKRIIDRFALDEERHFQWVSDVLQNYEDAPLDPVDELRQHPAESGYTIDAARVRVADVAGQARERASEVAGHARERLGNLVGTLRERAEDLASRGQERVEEKLREMRSAQAGQGGEYVELTDLEPYQLLDQAADALERVAAEIENPPNGRTPSQKGRGWEAGERTRARVAAAIDDIDAALTRRRETLEDRGRNEPLLLGDVTLVTTQHSTLDAAGVAERMEERAREVLREHRLLSVPVDPLELARTLGLDVHHAKFADPALVSTVARRSDRASILVRYDTPPEMRRVAITHALAHYILHLQGDGDFVDREVDLYRWTLPSARVVSVGIRDELEANLFAHALLMAEDHVLHAMRRRPAAPVPELAAFFHVPQWLAGFRLAQLGY